jgi:hypothetical protein
MFVNYTSDVLCKCQSSIPEPLMKKPLPILGKGIKKPLFQERGLELSFL